MKTTVEQHQVDGGKKITIEMSELDIVKHIESDFEKYARHAYERSNTVADLLLWLSEWAETEKL